MLGAESLRTINSTDEGEARCGQGLEIRAGERAQEGEKSNKDK